MATDNLERLLNLYGLLLQATPDDPATTASIADAVPYDDYRDEGTSQQGRHNLAADRKVLEQIGVPIHQAYTAKGAPGWWIPHDEYFRPGLHLTDGERRALARATRAIDFRDALWARVANVRLDDGAEVSVETVAVFVAPKALPRLQEARVQRATVTFPYHDTKRTIRPWGIGNCRGHWYLVGPVTDSGVMHRFRIDLIDEKKVQVGSARAFEVPADFDVADHIPHDLFGWGGDLLDVVVAVDAEIAGIVGREVGDRLTSSLGVDARAQLSFTCSHRSVFLSWVMALGPRAEVLAPRDLRLEVIGRLEAMVEAGDGP